MTDSDFLTKGIINMLIKEDENMITWSISLMPFSSDSFLKNHEETIIGRKSQKYIFENETDMLNAITSNFQKLADQRLAEAIDSCSDEVVKVFEFKENKKNDSIPIVKKHIIAESQDDLNKERQQDIDPIKIDVETPSGKISFIKNTSDYSLENPVKINVDEVKRSANKM